MGKNTDRLSNTDQSIPKPCNAPDFNGGPGGEVGVVSQLGGHRMTEAGDSSLDRNIRKF